MRSARSSPVCQPGASLLIVLVASLWMSTTFPAGILARDDVPVAGDLLIGFRKGPYLCSPSDPTTMTVHWQAYTTTGGALEWGTGPAYELGAVLTTEYGDDHQHAYTITDLEPSTHYEYRVTVEGVEYAASFRTAPDPGDEALKFIVHGDVQTGIPSHDTVCQSIVDVYSSDPAYQTLIVGLGDLSNYGAVESDWDDIFFNPIRLFVRRRLAEVPFHSVMGNHDFYETAWTWDIEGTVFKKYFPYPYVDDRYWSFDYGPAHFTIVDLYPWYHQPGIPDTTMPGFISPEQAVWLEQDLASTDRPWKFVLTHEGGWSAGPHPNNASVQDTLHPLCLAYDVDIVFSGHNHYYARAESDGVPYITTSGGANLYMPSLAYPNLVVTNRNHHFCTIEIDGSVLAFTALRPNGEIIDEFTIVKSTAAGAGPAPVPAAPRLYQNRPNPFNPSTRIPFEVRVRGRVTLRLYDVEGRLVRTLLDGYLGAAAHSVTWDGRDALGREVPSGVFWYRLESGGRAATRTLVLAR